MKRAYPVSMALAGALILGGVAFAATRQPSAPEPAKPVDAARFFIGRWYEIARTPMKLTDGCVAGTTDFFKDSKGRTIDRDACRSDTPEGKEKKFEGPITILDPTQSNKFRVDYKLFGPIHAPKTWWILDHGDDYQWFIVSDPEFKTVSLFTRAPNPAPPEIDQLTARAKALGYDASKLEHPAQFPPGEGRPPGR
jgi:apolipoprotein D and lipocalin family protein